MDLGDLLSELKENILHDRSDQIAGSSDQLWSDVTLCRYINEAQRKFARETLVIRDGSTPSVTQVPLTASVNQYELHPSVLAVLSCKQIGDTADMARAGHAAFDTYRTPDALFFDPSQLASLPPGKPLAYSTDEELTADDDGGISVVNLRVYPAPSSSFVANALKLRVIRLPINKLSSDDLTAEPEIPEDHHMEMLDWAAYLALRMVDVDAESPNRAKDFQAAFMDSVTRAKRVMMRKLFTPQLWGFGRNGFSWER